MLLVFILLDDEDEGDGVVAAGAAAGADGLAAGAGAVAELLAGAVMSLAAFLLLRLFFEELADWSLLMLSPGAALSLFIVESPDGAAPAAEVSAASDFLCFFDFLVEVSSAAMVPLVVEVSLAEASDFLLFFDFLLVVEDSLPAVASVDVAFVAD